MVFIHIYININTFNYFVTMAINYVENIKLCVRFMQIYTFKRKVNAPSRLFSLGYC